MPKPTLPLSKQQKLLCSAEFGVVFKEGKKLTGRYFAVFNKSNHLDNARLGVVVGKKAVSRAVGRNFIKRVIRETFRLNQLKLAGFDIVVVAYPDIKTLNRNELHLQLDRQWEKLASSARV